MTQYERPKVRPAAGRFFGFDHLEFFVSNAKQVATFYITRMGFEPYAYRGLETKSREYATHVVKQKDIILAFTSPLLPAETEAGRRIMLKGDAVKDIALACEDAKSLYDKAMKRGAKSVMPPTELKDEFGSVIRATIQTYGDTVHSFIQRNDYKGTFLPGYVAVTKKDPMTTAFGGWPGLLKIDHVVGNQPDLKMTEVCDWYEKCLDFHRFWSVDDTQVHTQYSALRSIVMCDFDRVVKMPMNEPAKGLKKSQIQEYIDYHGGPGVQHVALLTDNIIEAVTKLHGRGLEFLRVPNTYYDNVRRRLAKSPVKVKVAESVDKMQELGLLIDFDDQGYLLQIFTKNAEDRPTLFYEVIQRRNHEGFGAGNFKALFESIEADQAARGNLDSGPGTATPAPYSAATDGIAPPNGTSAAAAAAAAAPSAADATATPASSKHKVEHTENGTAHKKLKNSN